MLTRKARAWQSAVGRNLKGKATVVGYAVGIVLAYFVPLIGLGVYVVVVLSWLIPDRRVERTLATSDPASTP